VVGRGGGGKKVLEEQRKQGTSTRARVRRLAEKTGNGGARAERIFVGRVLSIVWKKKRYYWGKISPKEKRRVLSSPQTSFE